VAEKWYACAGIRSARINDVGVGALPSTFGCSGDTFETMTGLGRFEGPCEGAEAFDVDLFGAIGGFDVGRDKMVFDVRAEPFERGAQHFAALVERGCCDVL
jgi:hypothetical protein